MSPAIICFKKKKKCFNGFSKAPQTVLQKTDINYEDIYRYYFFQSSKSLSCFYFLGFIENKFFGVNLTSVSDLLFFFHFVSCLSHISHHSRELAPFCLSCSCLSKQISLLCIRAWKFNCGRVSPSNEGKPEWCEFIPKGTHGQNICIWGN